MDFVSRVINADKRSIARLITLIEEQSDEARNLLKQLYKFTGNAITIGITGHPVQEKAA